jgi:uncharacterized protein (UPF0335 family)
MTPTIQEIAERRSEAPSGNTNGQLKALVERIETVNESIREYQEDRKEIFQEAKSFGFDLPALRAIIRMRREDANKRAERQAILESYLLALGMAIQE